MYRPLKAIVQDELLDDRTVTKVFQKARAVFISEEIPPVDRKNLLSYFQDLNIKHVLTVRLCSLCNLHSRTTVLKKDDIYYYQDGMHQVCQSCALEELKIELSKRMDVISPSVVKYMKLLLNRTRNVDKILRHLKSDYENSSTDKLTLVKEVPVDEKSIKTRKIEDFEERLAPPLKHSLKARGITTFLPVQVIAIEKGLLDGKNLLIVASTSAGKTLIGEIAVVNNNYFGRGKGIFCFPLVALANTKYREFKRHYPSLKVALKVGKTRIVEGSEVVDVEEDNEDVPVREADIVVATYEGLDVMLRKNPDELGEVGTLIVDEIQTLEDPERGPVLDGLITRIRVWSPQAQIIGLSATIGNPASLTSWLGEDFELVNLNWRPVPLEEHLVLTREEEDKIRYMRELVEQETMVVSRSGYHGQTIIFTNSRRKAHLLSRKIRGAVVYHAGLPYAKRVSVEKGFEKGKYAAVVATYALGAGVDFPASQVIFETLMMGNRRLTVNEFHQMLGRAGRLGKHDRGKIVLLASPDIQIDGKTELELAIELLDSQPQPVDPHHSLDSCAEQVLANALLLGEKSTLEVHQQLLQSMVGVCPSIKDVLRLLATHGLVRLVRSVDRSKNAKILKIKPTRLGRAVSLAFLPPSRFSEIKEALVNRTLPIKVLATHLLPFEQVYIDDGLHSLLEKIYKMKMGHRFFDSQALDVLSAKIKERDGELPPWVLDVFVRWSQSFFDCKCKENPYCEHPPQKLSREILELRVKKKMSPRKIASWFKARYRLQLYAGDLFSWFDQLLFLMQGIIGIARILNEDVTDVQVFMKKIKDPYR